MGIASLPWRRDAAPEFARFRRKACYRVASPNCQHEMSAIKQDSSLRPRDVQRRFDLAAGRFHEADFVHRVAREGLLERMRPMTTRAATVVDLGCATGAAIPLLEKRFRRSRVIAVDYSAGMLRVVRDKKTLLSRRYPVQADARSLPFADASIDVIFSYLMSTRYSPPWRACSARTACSFSRPWARTASRSFAKPGARSTGAGT
jgi:SAM-dependent methyltransferase